MPDRRALTARHAMHAPEVRTATPFGGADGVERLKEKTMNQIIYIVGAVVIVIAILSFVGLS